MQYCEGGDLDRTIQHASSNGIILKEHLVVKWMSQIALALFHLQSHNIVHRDIKPVNILLYDNREIAVLADFGLAADLSNSQQTEAYREVGTPYYTSPEMINGEQCTLASDCWSFGVCVFELMALRPPFPGETTLALVRNILQSSPDFDAIPVDTYSADLRIVVEGLLNKNAMQRSSIKDFLCSPSVSNRAFRVVTNYRPKCLEERLKRFNYRFLTNQIEQLDIKPSASAPPTELSPLYQVDEEVELFTPLDMKESKGMSTQSISKKPADLPSLALTPTVLHTQMSENSLLSSRINTTRDVNGITSARGYSLANASTYTRKMSSDSLLTPKKSARRVNLTPSPTLSSSSLINSSAIAQLMMDDQADIDRSDSSPPRTPSLPSISPTRLSPPAGSHSLPQLNSKTVSPTTQP